ncbi:MAG: FAD:protein FMN transferase [Deltaproteobacteria bacterium]|nr:FAD:protein FMN transferase [Deltaproteobacteria bacterium]
MVVFVFSSAQATLELHFGRAPQVLPSAHAAPVLPSAHSALALHSSFGPSITHTSRLISPTNAAANAAANILANTATNAITPEKITVQESDNLVNYGFPIMTTEAHVILPQGESSQSLFYLAHSAIREVNDLMSPRGELSDVYRFNQSAPGTWVKISPLTYQVIEECLKWHKLSGGVFDPTISNLKKLFVFEGDTLVDWPDESLLASARAGVGLENLEMSPTSLSIRRSNEALTLDLGAAAKGFAVDRAIEILIAQGVSSALVEIGGEVRALGQTPPPNPVPWSVKIEDGETPEGDLVFEIINGAVATSGGKLRFFEYQGQRYSHIFNPLTGLPLEEKGLKVTVAHPRSCLEADIMSTTLLVVGPLATKELLESYAQQTEVTGLEVAMFYPDAEGRVLAHFFRVGENAQVNEVMAPLKP